VAKKGLIIVPKPGDLLAALAGKPTRAEVADYYSGPVMSEAEFKNEMLASWPAEPAVPPKPMESSVQKAMDAVNDFTRLKMREDGFYKKIMPPLTVSKNELGPQVGDQVTIGVDLASGHPGGHAMTVMDVSDNTVLLQNGWSVSVPSEGLKETPAGAENPILFSDPKFIGKSFAVDDTTAYVKKESHLLEFFAYETVGAAIGDAGAIAEGEWDEDDDDDDDEETSVDIAFWYYRSTVLIYSVRRVSDNFFYDFATKRFSLMPVSPRAGMPVAEPVRPGYLYSTRLSGKLDDGEYIVTYRDTQAGDVVIGIMALFMENGAQQQAPVAGLENTPVEEGLPVPEGMFRRAGQRVRPVDTGASE
jgi:hypothetical protein